MARSLAAFLLVSAGAMAADATELCSNSEDSCTANGDGFIQKDFAKANMMQFSEENKQDANFEGGANGIENQDEAFEEPEEANGDTQAPSASNPEDIDPHAAPPVPIPEEVKTKEHDRSVTNSRETDTDNVDEPRDLSAVESEAAEFNRDDTEMYHNETSEGLEGVDVYSGAIKGGELYIIKPAHPRNYELSWDCCTSGHPRASVETHDPVDWSFEKHGSTYKIVSQYPGKWRGASLSWDRTSGAHPMASVEHHDPVYWYLKPRGGNRYRIVNKHSSWKNAELSWDGRSGTHPRASVEYHDPLDWEIVPAYTVKGQWKWKRALSTSAGHEYTASISVGTVHSNSWSKTKEFSKSVEHSVSQGFECEGVSGSQTISSSVTRSFSQTVSSTVEKSQVITHTQKFTASPGVSNLWQFVLTTTNNHYKGHGETVETIMDVLEATGSPSRPPRCLPGYCKFNTQCQTCTEAAACIEKKDKYSSCPYWKRQGYCRERYVWWMSHNCAASCTCT